MEQYEFFLGVDWGTETHELCFRRRETGCFESCAIRHEPGALGRMLGWLDRRVQGRWGELAVGLERPHGLVVEMLMARGCVVFAINPKSMASFRSRYSVAEAKDDVRDARILCDTMSKDPQAWRRVEPKGALEVLIGHQLRALENVEQEERRLSNRLWDSLLGYYPALLGLTSGADEPWLWDLLMAAPTPERGAGLSRAKVGRILRLHGLRSLTAEKVCGVLRQLGPAISESYVEACAESAQSLVRQLMAAHGEAVRLKKRVNQTLEAIGQKEEREVREAAVEDEGRRVASDFAIMKSMPGVGTKTLACLYSEGIGPLRRRNYAEIRALSGVAPVTRQSGKVCMVRRRLACNGRLRQAMHHAANSARQRVVHWGKVYAGLRAKGQSHGRALRSVADRMLGVLVSMLERGELFDAARIDRHYAVDVA